MAKYSPGSSKEGWYGLTLTLFKVMVGVAKYSPGPSGKGDMVWLFFNMGVAKYFEYHTLDYLFVLAW